MTKILLYMCLLWLKASNHHDGVNISYEISMEGRILDQ